MKFPAFFKIRRFIEPAIGPYLNPTDSSLSLRSILILSSHLCLCLTSGLFP